MTSAKRATGPETYLNGEFSGTQLALEAWSFLELILAIWEPG